MIPVQCRVKHDPPHSYGDCIRACVASILEMDAEQVPHVACDGPSGDLAFERLRFWLKTVGYAPFVFGYPGDVTIEEIFEHAEDCHPDIHYMLFGEAHGGGAHVVVGKGGAIVHNPAWIGGSLVGPHEDQWQIVVLVKL